jgi:hypothetical protein
VEVSGIRTADNRISFDVDRPGVPVLVKASYFPNWEASGAEGPYRVAPNLMVVVPTGTHVEIHYGRTGIEWGAYALTLLGLLGLAWLARAGPVAMPVPVPYVPRSRRGNRAGAAGDSTPYPFPGDGPAGPPELGRDDPEWSWESWDASRAEVDGPVVEAGAGPGSPNAGGSAPDPQVPAHPEAGPPSDGDGGVDDAADGGGARHVADDGGGARDVADDGGADDGGGVRDVADDGGGGRSVADDGGGVRDAVDGDPPEAPPFPSRS